MLVFQHPKNLIQRIIKIFPMILIDYVFMASLDQNAKGNISAQIFNNNDKIVLHKVVNSLDNFKLIQINR